MVIMLVANLINAGLNWVLIYGNLGAPALGAMGAVLATSTVRWLAAGALIAVIVLRTEHRRYGVRGSLRGAWSEGRTLRRLGLSGRFRPGAGNPGLADARGAGGLSRDPGARGLQRSQ